MLLVFVYSNVVVICVFKCCWYLCILNVFGICVFKCCCYCVLGMLLSSCQKYCCYSCIGNTIAICVSIILLSYLGRFMLFVYREYCFFFAYRKIWQLVNLLEFWAHFFDQFIYRTNLKYHNIFTCSII